MALISLAPTFRAALFTRATTLAGSDVLVVRGNPAFESYNDIIGIGGVESTSEPAALGSTRPRQEELKCDVTVWSYRPGGDEQEAIVEARAYELLGLLEYDVRVTDTTLGVAGLQFCFLTDHRAEAVTDQAVLSKGRMHIITGTFTAAGRITS